MPQSLFAHYTYGVENILPPDDVRVALSVLSEGEHRFAVGKMDDATEALEKMLALIHDEVSGTVGGGAVVGCAVFRVVLQPRNFQPRPGIAVRVRVSLQ